MHNPLTDNSARWRVWLLCGALALSIAARAQTPEERGKVRVEATRLSGSARLQPATSAKDARALFTPQEQQLAINGLGNPVAQLLILRELQGRWPLTENQRADLSALAKAASPKLLDLRAKRAQQERALETAIYGANFDPAAAVQLADEAATTQQEFVRVQVQTELRFMQILGRGNPRRARLYRAFYEQVVQTMRRAPLPPMLLNRVAQAGNGQWRFIAEFFGDDWDMAIPGFGNPAAYLLLLNQLELTAEQKAVCKQLAQEIRNELRQEKEEFDKQTPPRPDLAEGEEPDATDRRAPMFAAVEQAAIANAARQTRQMKRQTRIETRIRQTLQPRQWELYVTLLRGIAANNLLLGQPALPPKALRNPKPMN